MFFKKHFEMLQKVYIYLAASKGVKILIKHQGGLEPKKGDEIRKFKYKVVKF